MNVRVYVLISEFYVEYAGTDITVLCAHIDLNFVKQFAKNYKGRRDDLEIQEYVDGVETSNYFPID